MFYVFDVDGTLTPSRGKIDVEFKAWFLDFARIDKNTGICYNVKNWQETWHILKTQQKESDLLANG